MKATAVKPAVGGAVLMAAVGTTLPTSADASASSFSDTGYISDDGISRTRDLNTQTVKAWGGDTVLLLEQGKTEKFKFTLIEPTNVLALKLVNGDSNVSGSTLASGISVISNDKERGAHAFVIDMIEAENTLHRICIPNGVVSALGETKYVDGAALGYEVEITAVADNSGNTCYEYFKTASTSSGSGG